MLNYNKIFKAISDDTRIRIVKLLNERDMYVCELEFILEISQPRISQNLKILKEVDLVSSKRDGQMIIYSLNKKLIEESLNSFLLFLNTPLKNNQNDEYKIYFKRILDNELNNNVSSCIKKKS